MRLLNRAGPPGFSQAAFGIVPVLVLVLESNGKQEKGRVHRDCPIRARSLEPVAYLRQLLLRAVAAFTSS
jgi:hypothetical protein